jgi:imidazolonepropionase-like amidohydrolase
MRNKSFKNTGNMAQESINLVISCKNLVDDTGAEPVSSGLVAIAGKRISYAGSVGEAPEFPNALVIDLPEATLLPGLIDMHTHPSYYWEEPDSGTYTYSPENLKVYTPITVALKASNYLHKALIVGHHHGAPTREEIDLAVTTPALC